MNPVSGALPSVAPGSPAIDWEPATPSPRAGTSFEPPRPYFIDRHGNAPQYAPSQDLARLLAALPPSAGAAFSSEQLAALDIAVARTRPRRSKHKIDYRVSVPIFRRRFYFVVLAGGERRTLARIRSDGQNTAWRMSLAYVILMGAFAMGGLVAAVMLLYVVKSMAGIDIFDQHSFLHGLFYGAPEP